MNETSIAFLPLEARAAQQAGPNPLDRISVRDYLREVEIGAFNEERGRNQTLRFNVVLEVAPHTAATDDDVDKVLSYDTIISAIETQLSAKRTKLLETLAERIAEQCLADPKARRAFVRIEKLDRVPGALGVEISRSSPEGAITRIGAEAEPPQERPRATQILGLGGDALNDVGPWIAALKAQDTPSLILPIPEAEADLPAIPAMRVTLLKADQLAWQIAAHDDALAVTDSRTEAAHLLAQGKICVIAPSKLIWDSPNPPHPGQEGTAALLGWMAHHFEVASATLVGLSGGDVRILAANEAEKL